MMEREIYNLPWARILLGNNELKLRAKTVADGGAEAADSLAIRFQVPVDNLAGSGWLGAIFADILQGSSATGPTERVQLKLGFKLDPGPVLELYATRPGGSDDIDEVRIFRFGLDRVEFGVPVVGLPGGGGGTVTRFYTDHGHFLINWQDDTGQPTGTIYRVDTTQPESALVAVGRVPIEMF